MPEEPVDGVDGVTNDGISRRRMLKRIGVATTVAWTVPVVSSLRTPAFAQVSAGACPPWACGETITNCGGTPCNEATAQCVCDVDVAGNPICWNDFNCLNTIPCSTNADCSGLGRGGWSCSNNCCGQTCVPPCGECAGGGIRITGGA